FDLLAMPGVSLNQLSAIWPEVAGLPTSIAEQLSIDARYAAYVARQEQDVVQLRRDEAVQIPRDLDFAAIPGLSNEVCQKLNAHRPSTLAQAARIEGLTPAALTLIAITVKKKNFKIAG
ncbi:MAG: tRNA uridine-5-carboxymethylaminomethyl(34) synthesis enzyme MnmG, partial [Pseudomonadota bacterium]